MANEKNASRAYRLNDTLKLVGLLGSLCGLMFAGGGVYYMVTNMAPKIDRIEAAQNKQLIREATRSEHHRSIEKDLQRCCGMVGP